MPEQGLADLLLHHRIAQFVYREALLQDDHRYDEWEALWADDGVYWIPANGYATDPEKEMSIVFDNRSRIALRVRQLKSGKRFTQDPKSALRRVISNLEVEQDGEDPSLIKADCNALVFESSHRGDTVWACRYRYVLRRPDTDVNAGSGGDADIGAGMKMVSKTVLLPNNDKALYTMSFLI